MLGKTASWRATIAASPRVQPRVPRRCSRSVSLTRLRWARLGRTSSASVILDPPFRVLEEDLLQFWLVADHVDQLVPGRGDLDHVAHRADHTAAQERALGDGRAHAGERPEGLRRDRLGEL